MDISLHELQPVVIEWTDAAGSCGWQTLPAAKEWYSGDVVSRGYFLSLDGDFIRICQTYGWDVENDLMVNGLLVIPLLVVKSVSPRKESLRERAVRLKRRLRKVRRDETS